MKLRGEEDQERRKWERVSREKDKENKSPGELKFEGRTSFSFLTGNRKMTSERNRQVQNLCLRPCAHSIYWAIGVQPEDAGYTTTVVSIG